jgi:hypothetical protein
MIDLRGEHESKAFDLTRVNSESCSKELDDSNPQVAQRHEQRS